MTTYFPFTPSLRQAPQFSPTLDGATYNCVCVWNLFAQRYYLNCYDQNSALVFSRPLVETSPALSLATLTWNGLSGLVTVTTQAPHGFIVGGERRMTISGCLPDALNGSFLCTVTGPSTFTFALTEDPGQTVVVGSASFLVNMAGNYFTTSTLIYRNSQFEVSP